MYCIFTSLRFRSPQIVVGRSGGFLLGRESRSALTQGPRMSSTLGWDWSRRLLSLERTNFQFPQSALSTVGVRVGYRLKKASCLLTAVTGCQSTNAVAAIQDEQHNLGSPDLSSALLHVINESPFKSRPHFAEMQVCEVRASCRKEAAWRQMQVHLSFTN